MVKGHSVEYFIVWASETKKNNATSLGASAKRDRFESVGENRGARSVVVSLNVPRRPMFHKRYQEWSRNDEKPSKAIKKTTAGGVWKWEIWGRRTDLGYRADARESGPLQVKMGPR